MTMHHCRCFWSRALYQVLVHMLMKKRPLLTVYNSLTHCRIPMSSVVVDNFTASFEVLSGLIKWFGSCFKETLITTFPIFNMALDCCNV